MWATTLVFALHDPRSATFNKCNLVQERHGGPLNLLHPLSRPDNLFSLAQTEHLEYCIGPPHFGAFHSPTPAKQRRRQLKALAYVCGIFLCVYPPCVCFASSSLVLTPCTFHLTRTLEITARSDGCFAGEL